MEARSAAVNPFGTTAPGGPQLDAAASQSQQTPGHFPTRVLDKGGRSCSKASSGYGAEFDVRAALLSLGEEVRALENRHVLLERHLHVVDDAQSALDRRVAGVGAEMLILREEQRMQKDQASVAAKGVASIGAELQVVKQEQRAQKQQVVLAAKGQKALAVSTKRALNLAANTQQRLQEEEWQSCLQAIGEGRDPTERRTQRSSSPISRKRQDAIVEFGNSSVAHELEEMRRQWTAKNDNLERRFDSLLAVVDALGDKVLLNSAGGDEPRSPRTPRSPPRTPGTAKDSSESLESLTQQLDELRSECGAVVRELQEKFEQLQSHVLAGPMHGSSMGASTISITQSSDVEAVLSNFESRLERSCSELGRRVDALQEQSELQGLSLWQAGRQLPELLQQVEGLSRQCRQYFSKAQEHDVSISFVKSNVEQQQRQLRELLDNMGIRGANRQESPRTVSQDSPHLTARLNDHSEAITEVRQQLREAARELPELTKQVEVLSDQCRQCFSKAQEQEVGLTFVKKNAARMEQEIRQLLDQSEHLLGGGLRRGPVETMMTEQAR
eukprot:gnl/TRDRNA2_/TRDRNA2_130129_c0_seq1.p1 gnl/TRDRNA2_/TRDRNA2_130129_c0~~gnl/TRDRNA2_/TRDRNA2_130129_c0_seq1.p1  ORF type:complete len:583 (+),score=116.03 gnl/TRDRNA2_/TRDRNA2_130129_c0_seq1:84-1751(+)